MKKLILLFLFSFPLFAIETNRVLATFGSEIVTLWELQREQAVIQKTGAPEGRLSTKEFLKWLVLQMMLVEEADKFKVALISEKESQEILDQFKRRFAATQEYENFVTKYELTVQEIRDMVLRPIRARKFLHLKLSTTPQNSSPVAAEPAAGNPSSLALWLQTLESQKKVRYLEP